LEVLDRLIHVAAVAEGEAECAVGVSLSGKISYPRGRIERDLLQGRL
jgi:hypothetical protein